MRACARQAWTGGVDVRRGRGGSPEVELSRACVYVCAMRVCVRAMRVCMRVCARVCAGMRGAGGGPNPVSVPRPRLVLPIRATF